MQFLNELRTQELINETKSRLATKQDKIQVTTMPTASASTMNGIYQFMGVSDSTFTHGFFYETTESSGTYSWSQVNVQPSSGGGGSYTAGDGIDIINDVISTKQSEEGDIDEIIDIYPTAGNLVSIVNAFNKSDIYSTDEKMIGQWVDGKPLYQKTVTYTNPSAIGQNTINMLMLEEDATKNYIDSEIIFIANWGTAPYIHSKLPYYQYADDGQLYVDMKPQLKMGIAQVRLITHAYSYSANDIILLATLKYTKTTDTAISIGEATEYSTDEKVVGTWIDGKPVYQKTWNNLNLQLNANSWTNTTISTNGLSKLIDAIAHSSNGTVIASINCAMDGNYVNINNTSQSVLYAESLTLQYTKTTT